MGAAVFDGVQDSRVITPYRDRLADDNTAQYTTVLSELMSPAEDIPAVTKEQGYALPFSDDSSVCLPYTGIIDIESVMDDKNSPLPRLPDASAIEILRDRPGVWLSFAGSAFLQLYSARLRPLGLRPNWVVALAVIAQHPNITQSALGRQMGINRASAMALSMALEAAGFLSRVAKPGRKQTGLTLTAFGQDRLHEACAIEDDLRSTLFGWMDSDALDTFIDALQRITNRVRQPAA